MKKFRIYVQLFNDGGGAAAGGGEGANGVGQRGQAGSDGNGGATGAAGANGVAGQATGGDKGEEGSKPAVSFASQREYEAALQGAVSDFLKGLGIDKADDLKRLLIPTSSGRRRRRALSKSLPNGKRN